MHRMCEAILTGRHQEAEELDETLQALHADLFVEANPIPVKWAVAELGHMGIGIRLPLTWLSDGLHGRVRAAMRRAGVL
jgi:4-hydroxy-tetrahydrodipicolinate synthase